MSEERATRPRDSRAPPNSEILALPPRYYGRHYFAYWRAPRAAGAAADRDADRWDGFDDASVRDAGAWEDVVEKVSSGRLMPLLLFFSRRAGDAAEPEVVT